MVTDSRCCSVRGLKDIYVNATDFKTLLHPITHVFMKMFSTNSAEVVTQCQQVFAFQPIIRNQMNCGKIRFFKLCHYP